MSGWVVAPVLLPLASALCLLFIPKPSLVRRGLASVVFAALLALSLGLLSTAFKEGPQITSWGGWMVPYGIVLVLDTFSALMLCLSAATGLVCALYGFAESPLKLEHPLRIPLFLLLLVGVNLSFLTGDLFNLFVAFEVLLLASYGLMTLEAGPKQTASALPYVTINLLGSALFLCVCAFTYGLLGSLNFAEIAARSQALVGDPRLDILALLLLLVFAIKAGLFPLYYWLPLSYSALTTPVAAFYAGLLTKVGVYLLARLFGSVLPHDLAWLHSLLAFSAGLTMVIGVLGAVAQTQIQRILSYHIVSQVGYMALAIGLFSAYAFKAAIVYIIHHILVKAALFLAGGVVKSAQGTDSLEETGGLWARAPLFGLVFFIPALSLAGIPPLSGFWGKFMIINEGISKQEFMLVAAALLASVLTLVSMLKIWFGAFWRAKPSGSALSWTARQTRMAWVTAAVASGSILLGVFAEPITRLAERAATETLNQPGYIERVRAFNQTPEPGKHP